MNSASSIKANLQINSLLSGLCAVFLTVFGVFLYRWFNQLDAVASQVTTNDRRLTVLETENKVRWDDNKAKLDEVKEWLKAIDKKVSR